MLYCLESSNRAEVNIAEHGPSNRSVERKSVEKVCLGRVALRRRRFAPERRHEDKVCSPERSAPGGRSLPAAS